MELREIARCIATIETALLSGFAGRIDFTVGGMMCRVVRSDAGIHYYYQVIVPHQVESAEELARIVYRAQHGVARSGRSRVSRESRGPSTYRSTPAPIRFTPGQSPK